MAGLGSALQSADGGLGAAAEFFDLHAHALGQRNEEVGERGVVLRVVSNMVAVFVAAASHQNGQVAPAMGGGVAKVGAK